MFLIFLTNVYLTCKNKEKSVSLPSTKISFTTEISFAILDQSRAIVSFVFEGEAGMGEAGMDEAGMGEAGMGEAGMGERVVLWFALTPPPLKWLTEQKNPKFLRGFRNTQRDTTNVAVKHGI